MEIVEDLSTNDTDGNHLIINGFISNSNNNNKDLNLDMNCNLNSSLNGSHRNIPFEVQRVTDAPLIPPIAIAYDLLQVQHVQYSIFHKVFLQLFLER